MTHCALHRLARFSADCLYIVAHRLYDTARRLDRLTYGVPWRDT